ncbi:carboxypeptidase-like regulatory domain-containing protein [Nocardioides speluncae]|uniref:carboxypeptidase-like regulatory domain-containing protein n=1 Tax=Nocardioides speluncae TaxID=2670337 RepID=UPI000D6A0030|nr:carboxypeptidase-like regulatory domain-containing protein [Nocardioides speluncae]
MPYSARLTTILISIALAITAALTAATARTAEPRVAAGNGVQGTITFATGVPASKVTVSAFRTRTATKPVARAVTGPAGRYQLALPRGSYFLRFHGGGAVTEFHRDAVTRKSADAIWVPRGRFVTANARVKPVKAVLTGRVYDAATKTPLTAAKIQLWQGFTGSSYLRWV